MQEIIEIFNRYHFLPTTEHTFTSIFAIVFFVILAMLIVFAHLFASVTTISKLKEEQKEGKNDKKLNIILFQAIFVISTVFAFRECLDFIEVHTKFKKTVFNRQSDQADFIQFKNSLTAEQADKLNKAIFILYQESDAETHRSKYSVSDKTKLYWNLPEVYDFIVNKSEELKKLD